MMGRGTTKAKAWRGSCVGTERKTAANAQGGDGNGANGPGSPHRGTADILFNSTVTCCLTVLYCNTAQVIAGKGVVVGRTTDGAFFPSSHNVQCDLVAIPAEEMRSVLKLILCLYYYTFC